ncbi:hypothetical protein WS51_28325 [Burkholderia territorii]|nr:hypothetical protein WS51_28325 [Burkholderia territorii]
MSRYSTVLSFRWTFGDHHVFADMRPRLGLRPGPWHSQCSSGAQIGHQFALESTTPLNVKRLIDGFVRDAHGFVIWKVDF